MQKLLADCPGLCGDIARYIYDRIEADQPGICLAASISFMGALFSKRIYYEDTSGRSTEPCIYSLVIADSGSGKSSAQNILKEIIKSSGIDTSIDGFLLGVPASDSALYKALGRNGRRFLVWDEIGIALGSLINSPSSCQGMILSSIMELFSGAGKLITGKEYATKDRTDVEAAYLSIFGASTPIRFFSALSEAFVADGLLPRWLLFFETPSTKSKESQNDLAMFESICDRIRAIELWTIETQGDLADIIPGAVQRKKIKVEILSDMAAGDMFHEFDYLKMEIATARVTSNFSKIFHTRAFEHVLKVCLALSSFDGEVCACNPGVTRFAIQFVKTLLARTVEKCESHLHSDSFVRKHNDLREKILNSVAIGETVSSSELGRKCQHWSDAKTRKLILDDFIELEIFKFTSVNVDDSKKRSNFYTRLV